MDKHHGLTFLFVCVGLGCITTHTHTALVEKLADLKICADKHCSYVISEAQALEDYVASDCRFINLRRGQKIYVFSKLKPVEGAGVFWSGSVYGERYVDQMGVMGYFPSNYINETHVFQKKTVEIPTTTWTSSVLKDSSGSQSFTPINIHNNISRSSSSS